VNINATIIGQSITFLIFVMFCMKFVWPALLSVMEAREQRIADDLQLAQQKATQQLKEAKEQAALIVDSANKRASQVVEEAKAQAALEAQRIKDLAQAEIDREIARARESLRGQVSALALAGAEKILGKTIDVSAHNAMLDKLAAEL
jgi:F-type H+-transporting ATPase subunit b